VLTVWIEQIELGFAGGGRFSSTVDDLDRLPFGDFLGEPDFD
jgi:hypothetical protein